MINYQEKFKKKLARILLILLIVPPLLFSYIAYKSDSSRTIKNRPNTTATIQAMKLFGLRGTVRDIKLSKDGTIAYVVASSRGIYILNLENPSKPKILSQFKYFQNSYDKSRSIELSSDERRLFVRDAMAGVYSIDIRNLAEPKLLAHYVHDKPISSFTLAEDMKRIYMSSGEGIIIADIRNPDEIKTIAHNTMSSKYYDIVEVKKSLLYLLSSSGIDIVDVSTPQKPKILKSYATLGDPETIILSQDKSRAFVSNGTSGIEVLNIKNKTNPKAIGSYICDTKSITIAEESQRLYVTTLQNNLQVIDISNVDKITMVKKIPNRHPRKGEFWNSALSPDRKFLYVSNGISGLAIIPNNY